MTEEREWIEYARRGDADAWEQLVRVHQQTIFRLAYLILGDPDDAEDVAQETFLHAYRALDRFDLSRPLRPWLLRIAANLCSNWRRSAGRYLAALQNLLRSEPPAAPLVLQAEQQVEADMLWKAVRRLRVEDQQVIYLRFFLDCSEKETAEVLGTAQGTIKSRQHRALSRLRGFLQDGQFINIQEESDVR